LSHIVAEQLTEGNMLKFYYAKNSAAFAPHILLEDIGAD